jgi:hypothetical protein
MNVFRFCFSRFGTQIRCRKQYYWMFLGIPPLLHFVLDIILVIRVSALYSHSKRVFAILLLFSFGKKKKNHFIYKYSFLIDSNKTPRLGNLAATLWACIRQANGLAASTVATSPPWQGCDSKPIDLTFSLIFYVPNLILSSIFLAMTVYKVLEIHEVVYGKLTWKSWRRMKTMSPLMGTFIRDGSVSFIIVTVACSFSLLSGTVHDEVFRRGGLSPWTFVLYSYAGARLVLNLRATGRGHKYDQSWHESMSTKVVSGPGGVCVLFA